MATESVDDDPKGAWWLSYLAGNRPIASHPLGGQLRTVDLFSGPGGLANGIRLLSDELGVDLVSELIVDEDVDATRVYAANHSSRMRDHRSVRTLVDFAIRRAEEATFQYQPELLDSELAVALGRVDVVLAGPPCQGHSNLNNQTRRNDPRNDLYLTVPAFATAVGATMCIIENVPAILNHPENVVETARQLFQSVGYHVETGRLSAAKIGWPQTRTRHFLIARRDCPPVPIGHIASLLRDDPRPIWWAIGHVEDDVSEDDIMRQVTELSQENRARIGWLFDNDEYELAVTERPRSHRAGTTYTAVYGRLRKNEPAPTITTGFMSPGRGRYTHPTRRRVLTPLEAARLQGFPDTYRFVPEPARPPSRAQLAKWIGDAVPTPLGYAAALSALGSGVPNP